MMKYINNIFYNFPYSNKKGTNLFFIASETPKIIIYIFGGNRITHGSITHDEMFHLPHS